MTESNIKVLLVEDTLLAQLAQKMSLEEEGCQVDVASTGEQAIELSLKNHYNLILMDIGLGDTDGFIVTKEIKEKSTENSKTPIIALTAHSSDDFRSQASECGMEGYIIKPLTPEKIHKLMQGFFHLSKMGKNN